VNLRDHRLRHPRDPLHQRPAAREQVGEIRRPLVRRRAAGLHLLQVMPGAEHLARAPQHDHPHRRVALQPRQRAVQRRQHRIRQRIQRAGPVHRHRGHPFRNVTQHQIVAHLVLRPELSPL